MALGKLKLINRSIHVASSLCPHACEHEGIEGSLIYFQSGQVQSHSRLAYKMIVLTVSTVLV
jgi:hypothetical protein